MLTVEPDPNELVSVFGAKNAKIWELGWDVESDRPPGLRFKSCRRRRWQFIEWFTAEGTERVINGWQRIPTVRASVH